MSTLNPNATITQAKAWLRARLDKGEKCPVCTQRAQVYKRKLNSSMARGLILMYRAHGMDWGHAPSTPGVARLGGELARLSMWGLVEELKEPRPDGGRAGWWRVTLRGMQFLHNEIHVPAYAMVYDGRVLGFDGADVYIKESLGTKFDYSELMAGL